MRDWLGLVLSCASERANLDAKSFEIGVDSEIAAWGSDLTQSGTVATVYARSVMGLRCLST